MANETEHSESVVAVVNAAPEVVLYDRTGRGIKVPAADMDYWVRSGFKRTRFDIENIRGNIRPLVDEVVRTWDAYIEGVLADGEIDPADTAAMATAYTALNALTNHCGEVDNAISARYPVRQGEAVVMHRMEDVVVGVEDDGKERTERQDKEIQVDPNEVDLYRGQGYAVRRT